MPKYGYVSMEPGSLSGSKYDSSEIMEMLDKLIEAVGTGPSGPTPQGPGLKYTPPPIHFGPLYPKGDVPFWEGTYFDLNKMRELFEKSGGGGNPDELFLVLLRFFIGIALSEVGGPFAGYAYSIAKFFYWLIWGYENSPDSISIQNVVNKE